MGGYWATGSEMIATPPSNIMTIATTLANTGRSMKNLDTMAGLV